MKPNLNLQSICSPIRPDVFDDFLQGYDRVERKFVIQGFTQGFRLGFAGDRSRRLLQPNLPSAAVYPDLIWEKIAKEVETGRVAGPFETPPFKSFVQSPIGLVPKGGEPGKFRMIFHLSAPSPELSVNGQTPRNLCSVHYHDFDEAVKLVQEIGNEAYIGLSNMEHAFRQVPIHPEDWQLLVFKAIDPSDNRMKYFVDKCLPFGSAVSC